MLDILYRDRDIVVCVKPAGVLSQDSGEKSMPALLREQLGEKEIFPVHRLDKAVGGVMVYALTQRAAAGFGQAIQAHRMEKIYQAVLRGIPVEPSGKLEDLLFHDKARNKTYVVTRQRKGVKDACLEYEVLRSGREKTLVQVRLHTGRTHQIRVQFASRRLPLVGDGKYGGKEEGVPLCLWSAQLSFPHPVTKNTMTFAKAPVWLEVCEEWFT